MTLTKYVITNYNCQNESVYKYMKQKLLMCNAHINFKKICQKKT
jgi:hypothetical protein